MVVLDFDTLFWMLVEGLYEDDLVFASAMHGI
jgi:hypothetical protein